MERCEPLAATGRGEGRKYAFAAAVVIMIGAPAVRFQCPRLDSVMLAGEDSAMKTSDIYSCSGIRICSIAEH